MGALPRGDHAVRDHPGGSPTARLSCAHEPSPSRRPRGCHGRRPRAQSGCSVIDGIRGSGPAPSISVTPQSPPPGSEALSRFYSQRLDWTDCEGAQCATLEVPVDYDNPQGDTIELALVKVPAQQAVQAARVARRQPGRSGRVRRRLRPGRRLHRRQGGARRLRRRRVRPARRGALGADRLRHRRRARRLPRLRPHARRRRGGADLRATPPRASRSPAARPPARCSAHVVDRGRRARHGRAAGHARRAEAHLPRQVVRHLPRHDLRRPVPRTASAGWCSTASSPPTSPPRSSTSARPKGFERATRQWAAYCVEEGDCPLGDSPWTT